MPPPRRMQNPTVMAIIMKRSDLEDGDPAEAELFAMTCFPPSVQDCSWLLIIPLCPSGTRGPPQAAFRRSLLVRQQKLRKPCGVDVAEHRRPRRQQRRIQKVHVELVSAGRRAVVVSTGIEYPGRLAAKEQANDVALIE